MKTKRILAIVSFSALIGLYLTITMPKRVTYISLALFALYIIVHYFTAKRFTRQLILSYVSVVLSLLYLGLYKANLNEKLERYDNVENTVLLGEVVSLKDYSGSKCFTIKVNTLNEDRIHKFNVNLYTGYPLNIGETVKLTGKYKGFTHKSNFIYNYSKDIYGYFYADDIKVVHNTTLSLTKIFSLIRNNLKDTAKEIYDEETLAVVLAMGLGDKEFIDSDTQQLFNYSGITHALTVSGLHVGFIALVLNYVLRYIPVKKKIKNIILCIAIFMFMGIIGFTPSIIRAGILTISMLIGRNLIIEMDNYTVLAIIVLITLILNPYSATNGSLLLSYSAYFGVITALQLADRKNYGKIKTSLLITTFAVMFSSPFLSMMDMNATIFSPFFNIALSPLIRCICSMSFFGTLLKNIPFISILIDFAVVPLNKLAIKVLILSTNFAKNYFGFALFNLGNAKIRIVIFSAVIAVAIAIIQFSDTKIRQIFVVAFTLFAVLCYNLMMMNTVVVKAFDSGSETSFLLTKGNSTYLVLTENISKKRMEQIIKYENIENVDKIIYCPKKYEEPVEAVKVSDEIIVVDKTGEYDFKDFSLYAVVENKNMTYTMTIGKTKVAFSHKKSTLNEKCDFYFFGSDTPNQVSADNVFYFYPLLKKHTEMAEKLNAYQLFDTLTFTVNTKTDYYKITEDVKNFGS